MTEIECTFYIIEKEDRSLYRVTCKCPEGYKPPKVVIGSDHYAKIIEAFNITEVKKEKLKDY